MKFVAKYLTVAMLLIGSPLCAQEAGPNAAEVRVRVVLHTPREPHAVPAVVWLSPVAGTPSPGFTARGPYTLLQKNRTFVPHLQVVPVGAVVQFPNADPYFHNVFSLFDGKRFDLGLYEAGSTKAVTFSREGVSYIFCNIHPEMSAVIVTLSTPYFAQARTGDVLSVHNVPAGEYDLEVWVEGVQVSALDHLTRRVRVTPGVIDLGEVDVMAAPNEAKHLDKFGHPYERETRPIY